MTIAEVIGRQAAVFEAALHWRTARAEYVHAFTSSAYTGSEVGAARERYDGAKVTLLEALERLDGHASPTTTTTGAARRVTELEGEIVLNAIAWLHAYEQDEGESDAANSLLLDRTNTLAESVREIVNAVGDVSGAAAS